MKTVRQLYYRWKGYKNWHPATEYVVYRSAMDVLRSEVKSRLDSKGTDYELVERKIRVDDEYYKRRKDREEHLMRTDHIDYLVKVFG